MLLADEKNLNGLLVIAPSPYFLLFPSYFLLLIPFLALSLIRVESSPCALICLLGSGYLLALLSAPLFSIF